MIIAAFVSLLLAQLLGLSSASAAAIIAILSVLDTRRSSLRIAWQRVIATVLALSVAVVVFYLFGYTTVSFGMYLLVYIPLAFLSRVEVGIAPSSVLAIHLWSSQQLTVELLINEILLMLVGAGIAIVLNWYMPSYQLQIEKQRETVEELLRQILRKMENFLKIGNGKNDAALIQHAKYEIAEAKRIVFLESENQVFSQVSNDLAYFEMRNEQVKLLEVMAMNLNDFKCSAEEARILSEMFRLTAEQLQEKNPAEELMHEIEHYLAAFRERELPKTRTEFEYRAMLFQLLRDLQKFIDVKVEYYRNIVN